MAAPSARPARRIGAHQLVPLLAGWGGDRGPGYAALAERLRLLVLDGRVPVGAVLPSERDLAAALATSRTTTAAAYRVLRETGFAAAGQGAGTWTALPAPTAAAPPDLPWPVQHSGVAGTADGRGDMTSAAPEAPPQVHGAYAAALEALPRYLPGHGYVTAGLTALRERIAARFAARGLPTGVEQVLVTSGAVHGLRLVLGALLAPGERVLVESPSYPLALDAFRRAGGRPVALPVEGGWDVAAAVAAVRQTGARLAYLMPDFQNPTGQLMPAETRRQLAAALTREGCRVVVDETTAELDLRGAAGPAPAPPLPPPFAASDASVITLGSASKTFWGGLRVGWVRADMQLVRRLTLARAVDDLGSPLVEQLATAHLLDRVDAVLAARRPALASRAAALREAVARHLPGWAAPAPDGGMVLWCRLPAPVSTAFVAAARPVGVVLTPGPRFGPDGAFEARLRLPFARPPEELAAAVALLAPVWRGLGAAGADPVEDVLVV